MPLPWLHRGSREWSLHVWRNRASVTCKLRQRTCFWLSLSSVWAMLAITNIVQSLSHIRLFATPCTAAYQASLSFTISHSLLKFLYIESVIPSNQLILCQLLLLLPSILSSIRVFSNESALHIRWPKYWSFSFSIRPSSEYSGLISFRTDWFDLLTMPVWWC